MGQKFYFIGFLGIVVLCFLFGLLYAEDKNYFPVREGNYWIYKAGTFTQKKSVTSIENVDNNEKLCTIETQNFMGGMRGVTTIEDYKISSDGVKKIAKGFEPKWGNPILKFPLVVGNTWSVKDPTKGFNGKSLGMKKYKIVSISAIVNTPAGKFKNCIKIISTYINTGLNWVYYYAPDVGLVKDASINSNGEESSPSVLTEYSVN